jgi:hypothetical protein
MVPAIQAFRSSAVIGVGDSAIYFFFAVFADSLNAFAVGAPAVPGFRILSTFTFLPAFFAAFCAAILFFFAWMFA